MSLASRIISLIATKAQLLHSGLLLASFAGKLRNPFTNSSSHRRSVLAPQSSLRILSLLRIGITNIWNSFLAYTQIQLSHNLPVVGDCRERNEVTINFNDR